MSLDALMTMMQADDLPQQAIDSFAHHYRQLIAGETGMIPESAITPVADLPDAEALDPALADLGRAHLHRAVIIKLNGGLGTSMGLQVAKSLLPVKSGQSFLELIVHQARHAGCPLVLMNSFSTQDDSLALLDTLPPTPGDLPRDFLQHRIPKIDQGTLGPVDWSDERLRWCPPGHGDLFTALITRGTLAALRGVGIRYAFVSNSDNLGATLDPAILGHVISKGLPFLMEVADRTEADAKGGHLAMRDGQLILRERAQCAPEDAATFQDHTRHRYFNTNNLWLDLDVLQARIDAEGGLHLPLIRNAKTVDPRDAASPAVYQLESAMGAAIAVFEGSGALRVPRSRFSPVKTTADLLRVRSDATVLTADHRVISTVEPPVIVLDSRYYKLVSDLEARFPAGVPSLKGCARLTVEGDWTFGAGVVVEGTVRLEGDGGQVEDGTVLRG
ncbi:MAG: UTP--glucose-1-phosphate uridylyltransferase [Myxococcota bacterium]|jgi:UTP--glucose-1-phosphate uridylyltransferase